MNGAQFCDFCLSEKMHNWIQLQHMHIISVCSNMHTFCAFYRFDALLPRTSMMPFSICITLLSYLCSTKLNACRSAQKRAHLCDALICLHHAADVFVWPAMTHAGGEHISTRLGRQALKRTHTAMTYSTCWSQCQNNTRYNWD